jgi:hypothetical protein
MDQHEADAEVGRLLRAARERWPDKIVTLRGDPDSAANAWEVDVWDNTAEYHVAYGPTPAEALRALLGES